MKQGLLIPKGAGSSLKQSSLWTSSSDKSSLQSSAWLNPRVHPTPRGYQHALDRVTVMPPEPRPHIRLGSFTPLNSSPTLPDKSTSESNGDQDQSISVGTLVATASGVSIDADASGVYTSDEFPNGFRWTQTIDTNVPLGGGSSPYVDPRPNDDTKPFYWTDAEEATNVAHFSDRPSRNKPASGVTTWQATLCLNGVNESTKTVQAFDCMTYGFTIDDSGTVTMNGPSSISWTNHQSTLSSEFSGWTFK